jgi:hypothetical protein
LQLLHQRRLAAAISGRSSSRLEHKMSRGGYLKRFRACMGKQQRR